MVVLHATDPATVHLSVAARVPGSEVASTERALYDDRALIRMLGMRRTVFVVPTSFAPVVQAACTDDIAMKQRKLLVKHLTEAGIAGRGRAAGQWLRAVEESTATALTLRGSATAQELSADEPRLRSRLAMAPGKTYAAQPYVTSRVLFQLAADGRIVRGRPLGTWLSGQHQWSPAENWLPRWVSATSRPRRRRGRRWRAPGCSRSDQARWPTCSGGAGWTLGQTRKALIAVEAVEVDAGRLGVGYVLPGDEAPEVASSRGWRSCPPSTRRRWAGRTATGTWASTRPSSSTPPATSARPSGPTAGSSAAGASPSPARSATSCWRTSAPKPRAPSRPKPTALDHLAGRRPCHARFRSPLEKQLSKS